MDVPEAVREAIEDIVGTALLLGNALAEGMDGNAEGLEVVLELVVELVVADGEGGGSFKELTSLLVKSRLNTRTSLIDPEKSSPTVLTGVKPVQPSLRVDVDSGEEEEIEYVNDVDDATLDPSTYAVSVLDEDEPE